MWYNKENYDLIVPIMVCLGKTHYKKLQGLLRLLHIVLLHKSGARDKAFRRARARDRRGAWACDLTRVKSEADAERTGRRKVEEAMLE